MVRVVLQRLTDATLIIAGLALFGMMVQVTADVTMKYLANRPISGTLEFVSAYYMVAGVFLPIAAVELARASIAVDVAYQFLPRGLKIACMFLVLCVSVAVYAVLAFTTFGDALRSLRIREVMMGNTLVSVWASRFVLPLSFALAALVCLYQLWRFFADPVDRDMILGTSDVIEEI